MISVSQLIRQVCKDLKIPLAELARRTGQSPQNLSMKLKRNSISLEEFEQYMAMFGVRYQHNVIYPDGTMPDIPMNDNRAREKLSILEDEIRLNGKRTVFQQKLLHDIRTSLQTLVGSTELALKHSEDAALMVSNLRMIRETETEIDMLLKEALGIDETQADSSSAGSSRASSAEKAASLQGRRVLVVDDNEMNREIFSDVLKDNGLLTAEADDGDTAVAMISEAEPGTYDFVLMDIMMPRMDGFAATAQIRALPNRMRAGIPIIAITASTSEDNRKQSVEAGMDAYLTKPLDASKLIRTLTQFL